MAATSSKRSSGLGSILPQFRNKADARTLNFLIIYFYTLGILWFTDTRLGWWRPLVWVTNATFSFVGAVATHNTMHSRVFTTRLPNQFLQLALTLSYGHPVSSYVPGHNYSHHMFVQEPKDLMRTTKLRYRWHLLNGLLFMPTVTSSVSRSDFRFLKVQLRLGRPYAMQCIREMWMLIFVSATLLYLDPRKFFFYFWIPHFFAQWGIVGMNILQHDGCDVPHSGKLAGPNSSRNFIGSFTNYLFLNNGYHNVHHLYPYMHWSHLPAAHEHEVKPYRHPELDQSNMGTYLFKTFIFPGKRVTFDGKPIEFPPDYKDPGDEDWIDYEDIPKKEIDTSFLGFFRFVGYTLFLLLAKTVDPMYTPYTNFA